MNVEAQRFLLRKPSPTLCDDIARTLALATGVFALPGSHRRDLRNNIRDLSRLLTDERSDLSRSYWASPGYTSAYLHYFLPWNLYRLSWLLPGLDLPLQAGAHILDLGSGPLTLPLALWLCRPDLREMPLFIECADKAIQPMQAGLSLFRALAGEDSPWHFRLHRGHLATVLRESEEHDGYDLVMAANVLNEPAASRRGRRNDIEQPLAVRIQDVMEGIYDILKPGGRCLLVEPGTRLGGKLIALSRTVAATAGFSILAPCTHTKSCPMLNRNAEDSHFASWCHFTFPSDTAPAALTRLSETAGLQKTHLSISCVLMAHGGEAQPSRPVPRGEQDQAGAQQMLHIRVISGPIHLPGYPLPARYACSEKGIVLLLDAPQFPPGTVLRIPWPSKAGRDPKTGFPLVANPIQSHASGGTAERTRPRLLSIKKHSKRRDEHSRSAKRPPQNRENDTPSPRKPTGKSTLRLRTPKKNGNDS